MMNEFLRTVQSWLFVDDRLDVNAQLLDVRLNVSIRIDFYYLYCRIINLLF